MIRPGLCADRVADWFFVVCRVANFLRRIMKCMVKVVWLMEARKIPEDTGILHVSPVAVESVDAREWSMSREMALCKFDQRSFIEPCFESSILTTIHKPGRRASVSTLPT